MTWTETGRKKARRVRVKVCEECGEKYEARSVKSMYCDTCRPIVHRRRCLWNSRQTRGYIGRNEGITCEVCREKKPHAEYDQSESGRYSRRCKSCRAAPREVKPPQPIVQDDWRMYTALTQTDALLQTAGGASPCYYCCHMDACRERVRALDEEPLPCFSGEGVE